MTLQGDSETRADRRHCSGGGGRLGLESRVQHINPMCVHNAVAQLSDYSCEDVRAPQWRQWVHMLDGGTRVLMSAGQAVAGTDSNLPLAPLYRHIYAANNVPGEKKQSLSDALGTVSDVNIVALLNRPVNIGSVEGDAELNPKATMVPGSRTRVSTGQRLLVSFLGTVPHKKKHPEFLWLWVLFVFSSC